MLGMFQHNYDYDKCRLCSESLSTELPVGAIVGFLMYNLGILGDNRTVFLGDNGSNALDLCAHGSLFISVQKITQVPVTALWLVAIPFIDAVGVITSRLLRGAIIGLEESYPS